MPREDFEKLLRLEKAETRCGGKDCFLKSVIYLSIYQTDQYEYGTERKVSFWKNLQRVSGSIFFHWMVCRMTKNYRKEI